GRNGRFFVRLTSGASNPSGLAASETPVPVGDGIIDTTSAPVVQSAESSTSHSAFKKDVIEFKIPVSTHIYTVNGTKLGEFLSDEFKKLLETEESKPRKARDTNHQGHNYLIHGNLEAIPLN
uniref:Uncharacterized protein n=1 Tax=Panagrolaimus sp. PS1159 TaxID=55785 RepID=A0AC35FBX8_9BILA